MQAHNTLVVWIFHKEWQKSTVQIRDSNRGVERSRRENNCICLLLCTHPALRKEKRNLKKWQFKKEWGQGEAHLGERSKNSSRFSVERRGAEYRNAGSWRKHCRGDQVFCGEVNRENTGLSKGTRSTSTIFRWAEFGTEYGQPRTTLDERTIHIYTGGTSGN
jgi:hypothetical protein